MENVLTYTEACQMDEEELFETNIAIDIYIEHSKPKHGKKVK